MSLEDLYREVILDHYRNPRNKTPLVDPKFHAEGVNPLCGDEVTVELNLEDGTVAEISVRGQGCSISQSSGSMMAQALKGKSQSEMEAIVARFKHMLTSTDDDGGIDPDRPGATLGELEALYGVRRYPVRIKCAYLAWSTLEEAVKG